ADAVGGKPDTPGPGVHGPFRAEEGVALVGQPAGALREHDGVAGAVGHAAQALPRLVVEQAVGIHRPAGVGAIRPGPPIPGRGYVVGAPRDLVAGEAAVPVGAGGAERRVVVLAGYPSVDRLDRGRGGINGGRGGAEEYFELPFRAVAVLAVGARPRDGGQAGDR